MSPPRLLLPVPMYLPFQPEYGIHTSMLMFESEVGVKVAATRQNAGKLSKTGPPGTANFPVRTNWAAVIAVSGSAKLPRLVHVAAAASGQRALDLLGVAGQTSLAPPWTCDATA